ncbi:MULTISPECIES: N-formylglutamate amidohydrolase [unclassified Polaribacter]|uniref:N-formylglutamate amidohydrolase n=1 Tax=unclassified Polaribacter TaxID=196858 RepID=UPI0011BF0D2D|nr:MULTISPECIES: N-formylglutamate amidohydrolase [unclassified Polaribacter]TXD53268.1 N-formylglutamate amidohydrolase [Polaribacter sp. IC063]TXD60278.1 N-formylglutamate amidohydrolase [Polaribacter sp. IC066]
MKLIITCEHGGNEIPEAQQHLFLSNKKVLQTHKGFDLGALDVYHQVSPLASFAIYSTTSRLLIELNRSLHHKNLFSEFSKSLSTSEKEKIITSYYLVYRNKVAKIIQKYIEQGNKVMHISVHSFTPVLNAIERNCDIGLLYDSSLTHEKAFAHQMKTALLQQDATLNVRYNYPYLGKADGFTTSLRKEFPENYIGIELEINQKYASDNLMDTAIKKALYTSIKVLKNNAIFKT